MVTFFCMIGAGILWLVGETGSQFFESLCDSIYNSIVEGIFEPIWNLLERRDFLLKNFLFFGVFFSMTTSGVIWTYFYEQSWAPDYFLWSNYITLSLMILAAITYMIVHPWSWIKPTKEPDDLGKASDSD